MASEWREVEIGKVASEITVGYVGTMSDEYVTEGVPFLRSLNIAPYRIVLDDLKFISHQFHAKISKSRLRPGDLAVVRTGKPGTAAVIPKDIGEVNCSDLVIIRPSENLDTEFLAYYFNSFVGQNSVNGRVVGSVQKHFNVGDAKTLRIMLPPIDEQLNIAHILGSLDDKIELNRRMNATLEETARALFKSWFVDFDPVRAKMEGQQPEGIDTETAALFPDRLVESELGLIPEGWSVGTLGEVANNPRRSVQPQLLPANTLYIGLEHMPQHNISLSEWGAATDVESNKYQFFKGEILFGKLRPYFHKVGIAPIDGICSTDMLVVSPITPDWWGFVLMTVSDTTFIDYTTQLSGGTRMPRVNWSDMAKYEVVIPSGAICRAFGEFMGKVGRLIIENVHQAHTLALTRDTLLPKLLSGEVRITSSILS